MTVEGRINLSVSITYPCPTGMEFTIAEDSTHHVPARTGSDEFLQFCCAETLTDGSTVITNDDFRAVVAAQLGLVDGGAPTQTIGAGLKITAPGTEFFFIIGESEGASGGIYEPYWIRFVLVSEGVYRYDGKGHYQDGALAYGFINGAGTSGCIGCATIGNYVYFVDGFGTAFTNFREELVRLPLAGDDIEVTFDSWASRRFSLPAGDMTSTTWWTTSSRDPKNHATVFPHANGIGVLAYRTTFEGETDSILYQTVVDPDTNTNDGQNDISATFGIPFADEYTDSTGSPSVFGDDAYTNPIVTVLEDGRLEWMFPRGYSDRDGMIGYRRFLTDADLGNVESFPLVQLQITNEVGITLEAVHYYLEGEDRIWMIREDSALTFRRVPINITIARTARTSDVNIEGL